MYILLWAQHQVLEYRKLSKIGYSFPTIRERFGSWTKALIASGIPIINAGKANKEFILIELNKWYNKNNNDVNCLSYWTLRKAKAAREFIFSPRTIKNNFDGMSWEDIMKKIDINYETQDPFVKKILLYWKR